jgi:hypothetical protein
MTITTGMIPIRLKSTVRTTSDMSTQCFGATVNNGSHRLPMAGEKLTPKLLPIRFPMLSEDVG